MEITSTAFTAWSGGRFVRYGEPLDEARWLGLVQQAYANGIRTFITADVFGAGAADALLGEALRAYPRDSYCLVGAIGHDIYCRGEADADGPPRFTHPDLRPPSEYADYLRRATEKSLERCRVDRFDVLLLQNPDATGFTSDRVWAGLERLVEADLTLRLGVAPGPGNGFALDTILCFERFGSLIDHALLILNPLEPQPGQGILRAAVAQDISVITRKVDASGLLHEARRPDAPFILKT